MENKKFIGTLEKVKRLPGLMTNLEIIIDNEKFYRRITEGPEANELNKYLGGKVEIEYHWEETRGSDYWMAKFFVMELKMPKKYNQVTGIRKLDRE